MNNIYLDVAVNDLRILEVMQSIPSGNRNYIYLRFRFSNTWVGLTKTAIFSKDKADTAHVIIEDDTCLIPAVFMADPGRLSVSVFAGDRRTVNAVSINITQSGYQDGEPPLPPAPPSVYVQSPDGSVPFIKAEDGAVEFFYEGKWHTVKGGAAGNATEIEMGGSFVASNPQGILQGVTINETDTVFEIFKKAFRKAEPPVYHAPLLSLAGSNPAAGNIEIGTSISPTLTPSFNQRNGGAATQRRIIRGGAVVNTSPTVTAFTDTQFQLLTATTYSAAVDFGQGEILNDSLGDPDPDGRIEAGTVTSANVTYTPVRRAFFGALSSPDVPITSDDVRALPQNTLNPANGTQLHANITSGTGKLIAFAYPVTLRAPTSIMDGGLNVLAGYIQTTIQVAGVNNASPTEYRLIYTTNAVGASSARTVTLTI
jgi:hypothetical protein